MHSLAIMTFDKAGLIALSWAAIFGLVGMLLMFLGFKIFDRMTPHIDVERELAEKQNIAVAIVCASIFISLAIIIAAAIAG
ncbi:MAG TPA: DUF350 domain-containing protein [Tepidisphaeraceae bacterium]|jgi:putative membrane protein|nr:DUF350 domain-containing protein [Tepidisphaeraceae bacterium]